MKIREIASGLQFPEGPVAMQDGSVLLVEIARGTLTRVLPDGRTQVVAALGGGPNGAAIDPEGHVVVCNNGGFKWTDQPGGVLRPIGQPADYSGGRIERVNLATGKVERMLDTVDGIALRGPNDLVFDAQGGFYFTDLGKVREREMDRGAIFYVNRAATHTTALTRHAMTPNGIGLSPDGQTLYYAETEGARLWAFDLQGPGRVQALPWPSPQGARLLVAAPGGHYQRFDSLALDALGNILVATLLHGGITVVSPDGKLCQHFPLPDPYITNCCFGGPQRRTLYITASGSGKLLAIDDWPIPGLALHGQAA
jgi:gluconolactonase